MRIWIAIIAVAVISAAFKGCGPAFLGRRELPPRLAAAVTDLPAIVLAALVASASTGPHWAGANPAILTGSLDCRDCLGVSSADAARSHSRDHGIGNRSAHRLAAATTVGSDSVSC